MTNARRFGLDFEFGKKANKHQDCPHHSLLQTGNTTYCTTLKDTLLEKKNAAGFPSTYVPRQKGETRRQPLIEQIQGTTELKPS